MTLEVRDILYSYGKKKVLDGISVRIEDGEIYTLLGGSGSGKTTLMNVIAGFLDDHGGRVLLDGREISGLPPEKRGVGMVFQEYALFPHMTVESNISFPLKVKGVSRPEMHSRVTSIISKLGLSGLERNMPSELSGGERQRVALARMLTSDPRFLLLDEPLSALDASLRDELRKDLRSLLKDSGMPALYVTHDQVEAMAISDRIGFLHGGRILEEGTPEDLFWRPGFRTTAEFMGMHNIFRVRSRKKGILETDIGSIPWPGAPPDMIAFRPGASRVEGEGLEITGRLVSGEYRGLDQIAIIDMNGRKVRIIMSQEEDLREGSIVKAVIPHSLISGLRDDRRKDRR